MTNQSTTCVNIEAARDSILAQPDGTILIKDSILGGIVASAINASSSAIATAGSIQPMISITVK